jgi:hypothetical protein
MSGFLLLSRRSAIKTGVALASTALTLQAQAFWPLLLRGLLFGGVRSATAARTAAGAGAATVAGRAYAAPARTAAGSPVLRQVQNGYRIVRLVDQFGRVVGERREPNYEVVEVQQPSEAVYSEVQLVLQAENTHPQCGQSFHADFHLVSPQGQRIWAGGQQFCVPPGNHDLCFAMAGVPGGWQVVGSAHAGHNTVRTQNVIYV